MARHLRADLPPGVPTQVAHPWRAVLRTIVAAVAGWAVTLLIAVLAHWGIDISHLETELVASTITVLSTVLTGVFTWLLTRPRVEGFLERVLPFLATGVHTERED